MEHGYFNVPCSTLCRKIGKAQVIVEQRMPNCRLQSRFQAQWNTPVIASRRIVEVYDVVAVRRRREGYYYYCRDDYVTVYALRNGSVTRRLSRPFCGTNHQRQYVRLGGIRIRFITDQEFNNRGFVANFFTTRQSDACVSRAESLQTNVSK